MPKDSTPNAPTSGTRGGTTDRLKEIRDRVAELQRRIKTDQDPKAVAELGAALGQLAELLDKLVAQPTNTPTAKAGDATFAWPRDLSTPEEPQPTWGHDPREVTRG